jgi:hypothetical protein
MSETLNTYNTALDAYTNAAADADKASLGDNVKTAHAALSADEQTANPLPAELATAPAATATGSMGGRKSSRKSGGSRANKRGGKRASKRGGSRSSKRGGSRASKRGGKRGGSRSSRR